MTEHQKILMEVASVATCGMDLHKLGVYLKRDQNDIWRLANGCQDVQHAAYQILCSFYNSVPNKERWGLLIDALIQVDQRVKVKEPGLDELDQNAQSHPH